MNAADFFAGMGGFSDGAVMAGMKVVFAGNHWRAAVDIHAANHPGTLHACEDLTRMNMRDVPRHDILLASPCCQGHSPARGKANGNPEHDTSRATAWAVIDAIEYHRPEFACIENVLGLTKWALYPAWCAAWHALGYALTPLIVDAADHGTPQHRVRLFIAAVRAKHPLEIKLEPRKHVPASSIIDFDSGNWSLIFKPGRADATIARVRAGRAAFGDRFVMPYYGGGSGLTGRDIERPLGTVTTRDRWALVDGCMMRMLTAQESRGAMGFSPDTILPDNHVLATHLLGNAVAPKAANDVLRAMMEAA